MTKLCSKCKANLPLENFDKRVNNPRYYCSECRKCRIGYSTAYARKNRARVTLLAKKSRDKRKKEDPILYKLKIRGFTLKKYWPECSWREALDKYNKMFEKQNGCCALCGKHQSSFIRSLAVEHNHKTKKVRSLTCYRCNSFLIGIHTKETAIKLAEYFEKYDG